MLGISFTAGWKGNLMVRLIRSTTIMFSVISLGFAGCPSGASNQSGTPSTTATPHDHDHGDHDASDMEKMKEELAKLSPEDAAAAEKQYFCPVSDEMLGTMGPPLKVDVNGNSVWICCEGCREDLLADPEKYLAKLKSE
jgi:Cu(I)/Ag(I) efflux system membrane fusion protein